MKFITFVLLTLSVALPIHTYQGVLIEGPSIYDYSSWDMPGWVGGSFGRATTYYPMVGTKNGAFELPNICNNYTNVSSTGDRFQVYYFDSANWNLWQSGGAAVCLNPDCGQVYSTTWSWSYTYPRSDTYYLVVQCRNSFLSCSMIININTYIPSGSGSALPSPTPAPQPPATHTPSPAGSDQWCSCSDRGTCEVIPRQVCTPVCSILFILGHSAVRTFFLLD